MPDRIYMRFAQRNTNTVGNKGFSQKPLSARPKFSILNSQFSIIIISYQKSLALI